MAMRVNLWLLDCEMHTRWRGRRSASWRRKSEPEIARTCENIMRWELAMVDWVWQQLPPMTHKYLQRSEAVAGQAIVKAVSFRC